MNETKKDVSSIMDGISPSPKSPIIIDLDAQAWGTYKSLDPREFDSPDVVGSHVRMNAQFLQLLDTLMARLGRRYVVSSGYRTFEYNATLPNASVNSAHIKGLAADLVTLSGRDSFNVVDTALDLGITRIGTGKNFVHLDMSTELPQQVLWTY